MAKENGIGMTLTIDDSGGTGRAITNDVTQVSWTMPSDVEDITGLDKTGHERLHLLADFTITVTGAFNDASNLSFAVFKDYRTLASNQVGRTTVIVHSGQTLSNEVLYSDFGFNRGANGSLQWTAPGSLSNGTLPAWS